MSIKKYNEEVIFTKYITLKNGKKLYAYEKGKKFFVIPVSSLKTKKVKGN